MRSIASTRRLALIAGAATLVLPLAAHAAGSITGTIELDGQAPQRQTIQMSADPQCEAANPNGRMGDVFLVKDGKVQNVFVYVKEGLGDQKFEIPAGDKPHVDQIGCMYTPRVQTSIFPVGLLSELFVWGQCNCHLVQTPNSYSFILT